MLITCQKGLVLNDNQSSIFPFRFQLSVTKFKFFIEFSAYIIHLMAPVANIDKINCYTSQMRFLIGGERVTCRGLNLFNSLGRIKLTNSLGKQQLELWTRT